ncbi:hypothetical protein Pla175_46050 [Pirellulimonas nuda]|uniref:Lipid/polyisoprenoid-binding YceI-like domain-containing protein n=1 Tax=Pirellulimonas nuda TaxID=2528009 RepID=A0A518DI88_9BACT|nr:YceI family protein [Pirellulimonas nuda]QDU91185.1 hypothetical protein Pla175_46050 [Pirellulimonas nuda]
MRRSSLLAVVACAFGMAPWAYAQPERLAVDPAHTSVVFSISHMELSFCYGMFKSVGGDVMFDRQDPSACQFQFVVNVGSIDTAQPKRDQHLLSADFFDAEQFPQITFVSKAVKLVQDANGRPVYQVAGDMTLHGVTREMTLPVVLVGDKTNPQSGQTQVGFLCQTTIKRSDFGMSGSLGPIGDAVGVTVSFEATPPQPQQPQ